MQRSGPDRPSRIGFSERFLLVAARESRRTEYQRLLDAARIRRLLNTSRERPAPLQLSTEVTHPAPMSPQQIKRSIEARAETNQDIKFLDKKQCAVCLSSWKEILLEESHLVFTHCGHVYCRPCALRIASEGRRECSICKRSLAGVIPPFRRLHLPLDPQLMRYQVA